MQKGIILKLTFPLWQIDCDYVARNHMVKTETSVTRASMEISETWSWAFNTLRTGDADLRFYITTVQDG